MSNLISLSEVVSGSNNNYNLLMMAAFVVLVRHGSPLKGNVRPLVS
jgi:hypothetical protein